MRPTIPIPATARAGEKEKAPLASDPELEEAVEVWVEVWEELEDDDEGAAELELELAGVATVAMAAEARAAIRTMNFMASCVCVWSPAIGKSLIIYGEILLFW